MSQRDDEPFRMRSLEAVREKSRWGYRRLQIVPDETEYVNHKQIYRVYQEAGLMIQLRARKRLRREGVPRPALTGPNQEWMLDFVHDAAASGRKFRVLNMIAIRHAGMLDAGSRHQQGQPPVTRVLSA